MSKWFILALVVGALLWRWLQGRQRAAASAASAAATQAARPAQAMLTCEVCGALMDARLATPSATGYLCREHRHGPRPPAP